MSIDETQKKLNDYFTEKLETFGATAKGVDYNGEQAQQIRFAELVKVINPASKFSVIDYGSGYGAMFEYIRSRGWDFEYYGVDLIEKMVIAGREKFKDFPNAHFAVDEKEIPVADYLVAAGIFNIKLEADYDEWKAFAESEGYDDTNVPKETFLNAMERFKQTLGNESLWGE